MKFFKPQLILLAIFLISITGCIEHSQKWKVENEPEGYPYLTAGDTTKQLMKEEEFWIIIDKSKATANGTYQVQIGALKTILKTLDENDLVKFSNTFTALMAATYNYKLWGAAYVINGGCSDDCFDYFREYLIAHGRDKFYATIKDPESCADWIRTEMDDNWEGLQASIFTAYKEKTGKELPLTYRPKMELKGEPFKEETVDKQYPKLARRFVGEE
jgi:hypothetical protein